MAYISSNSWLKAKYGESTRSFFSSKHTPRVLLEVGKDVFDSAIVDSSILVVQEGHEAAADCIALDMDSLDDSKEFPPNPTRFGSLYHGGTKPWVPLSPIERGIMDKMQAVGVPLREWDISIYYGVKTGYNAAFVVDGATRSALVEQDPRSEELLKPILRGRDIRPYRAQWAGLWLLDVHNGFGDTPPVDVAAYPAIRRHLDAHWEAIARRQDQGSTPYNLRNCAYHEEFTREKIVWIELVDRGRFAFDNTGIFVEATAFMMTGRSLQYLCAVLNSSLTRWFLSRSAPTSGMGVLRWKKAYIRELPVPAPSKTLLDSAIELVESASKNMILKASVMGQIDQKVDDLVCMAYGLSERERMSVFQSVQVL